MLKVRSAADRVLKVVSGHREQYLYLMTSAGPSVDQLPPPPPGHRLLVEGQAAIPFSEGNEVFYNKVQEFNRDLSVHVIKLFAEKRLREKTEQALRKTRKVGFAVVVLVVRVRVYRYSYTLLHTEPLQGDFYCCVSPPMS